MTIPKVSILRTKASTESRPRQQTAHLQSACYPCPLHLTKLEISSPAPNVTKDMIREVGSNLHSYSNARSRSSVRTYQQLGFAMLQSPSLHAHRQVFFLVKHCRCRASNDESKMGLLPAIRCFAIQDNSIHANCTFQCPILGGRGRWTMLMLANVETIAQGRERLRLTCV